MSRREPWLDADDGMFELFQSCGPRIINRILRAGHLDADKFAELDDNAIMALGVSRAGVRRIRSHMRETGWEWAGKYPDDSVLGFLVDDSEWAEQAAQELRKRGYRVQKR